MIDAVADHVHERVAELLDDELVEDGLGAADDEADLLVEVAGELADDAGQLVEDLADRDHADVEDALLQERELAGHVADLDREFARDVGAAVELAQGLEHAGEVVLDEAELADEVHQEIEAAEVDADGLAEAAQALLGAGGLARGLVGAGLADGQGRRLAAAGGGGVLAATGRRCGLGVAADGGGRGGGAGRRGW